MTLKELFNTAVSICFQKLTDGIINEGFEASSFSGADEGMFIGEPNPTEVLQEERAREENTQKTRKTRGKQDDAAATQVEPQEKNDQKQGQRIIQQKTYRSDKRIYYYFLYGSQVGRALSKSLLKQRNSTRWRISLVRICGTRRSVYVLVYQASSCKLSVGIKIFKFKTLKRQVFSKYVISLNEKVNES